MPFPLQWRCEARGPVCKGEHGLPEQWGRFSFEREAEMKRYEVVREIENNCKRNQMRDVLFFEVETDDPVEWVRQEVKGKEVEISTETNSRGELTVFAESAGLPQKFFFTEI